MPLISISFLSNIKGTIAYFCIEDKNDAGIYNSRQIFCSQKTLKKDKIVSSSTFNQAESRIVQRFKGL